MNPSQQQLRRAFRNVPEELQEVITSIKTIDDTRGIGKNNALSQVQIDKTEIAVLYVLLGIERVESLSQKLRTFEIEGLKAQKIAGEIDKAIFWPVRDLLAIAQNNYQKIASETPTTRPPAEKTIGSVLFARSNK